MPNPPAEIAALVVAAFGRHFELRLSDGRIVEARPIGRKLNIVCGDRVRCEFDAAHAIHLIVEVLPRSSLLARSNARGVGEAVIANVTQLVVVVAAQPRPDLFVLDRYLCAASSATIKGLVVANKADLAEAALTAADHAALDAAGYATLDCSTRTSLGLDALRQRLAQEVSVFVGQSGVGKSSLIASLLPQTRVATQELSRDEEGKHTTTAARLYELPTGGALIDSPGVRDFAPAIDRLDAATLGFPEVAQLAPSCRFRDCKHLQEPDCAVRGAVEAGSLDARRYESYRRLRRLHNDLTALRHPSRRRGEE